MSYSHHSLFPYTTCKASVIKHPRTPQNNRRIHLLQTCQLHNYYKCNCYVRQDISCWVDESAAMRRIDLFLSSFTTIPIQLDQLNRSSLNRQTPKTFSPVCIYDYRQIVHKLVVCAVYFPHILELRIISRNTLEMPVSKKARFHVVHNTMHKINRQPNRHRVKFETSLTGKFKIDHARLLC